MAQTLDTSKIMTEEMQHIMEHAHALVDATSGELDERIKLARAALKERLDSAKGECGEIENRLLEKAQVADDFIRERPYQAIGGTLIAGLFLGWFMSRK